MWQESTVSSLEGQEAAVIEWSCDAFRDEAVLGDTKMQGMASKRLLWSIGKFCDGEGIQ